MILSNDEKNTLVSSLLRTFSNFPKFNSEYFLNLLNSIENGQPEYEGINVDISKLENSINPYLYLSSNINNAIYYHLCQLAQEDSDILLELVESKKTEISMICRKYNIIDDNQKESYLIEAINLYDGKESFRLFINHYITFKITGKKYNVQEEKSENLHNLEELKGKVKKFKKKKKEKKKSFNHVEIKTKEETIAQEQAVQNILDIILSSSPKKKEDGTKSSKDKVVAKKAKIIPNNELKKIKKSEEASKPIEEVKVGEEQKKPEEVIKPSKEVKVVEVPVKIAEESVAKYDLEKPVENKNIPSTEEVSVTKELDLSPYQRCLSKTKNIVGQETGDDFVKTIINLGIIDLLDYSNDSEFEMYILLRFGFINDSFYTIEQIASITDESIQKILTYENFILKTAKNIFDNKLNAYQAKVLSLKND